MQEETNNVFLKESDNEPLMRIALFESQDFLDLKIMGEFSVADENGNMLINPVTSELKWRVKIKDSKPGKEQFFIVLFESFQFELTEEKLKIAKKIDENVEIKRLGGNVYFKDKKINNNVKYVLTYGYFPTEIEARKNFKRFQPEFVPYVEKTVVKQSQGHLEAFDAEYEYSAEAANAMKIIPSNIQTKIKLFGIRSFEPILQKYHHGDLVFNGTMEFRFDNHGSLMGVSEVPLETYLKRVVFSEVGSDLPYEFLKSFAIVARSEAMARIGHVQLGAPYDYCNFGHSLRYMGIDYVDDNIDKAVEETRGQVLTTKDYIRDTPFHLVCGGHTEDASGLWGSLEKPFFIGRYDWDEKPKNFTTLKNEKMAKKWIEDRPQVWCNLKGMKIPPALEKYKQSFRWEISYARRELEDIIRKRTGEDIGTLFDIFPLSRGNSGRLNEIELIGSLKNYRIRGQLNIREALAYDYLPSSCFIVEKELDDTGTPIMFNFIGAGQGHGVGLCKTGAAVMAHDEKKFDKILKHYFEDSTLSSIYELDHD